MNNFKQRCLEFRAFIKKHNVMVYYTMEELHVSPWLSSEKGFLIKDFFDSPNKMQYTEYSDKNGQKIWEGDICKNWKDETGVIDFIEGGWMIKFKCGNEWILFQDHLDVEVIGNVFENPELLEEEKL
jgi:uncharacterized phage protein (TIGR01671 family)